MFLMSRGFPFYRRRPRRWLSYCYYGCLYDRIVLVVMRCPVINGAPAYHLAWQHAIRPV